MATPDDTPPVTRVSRAYFDAEFGDTGHAPVMAPSGSGKVPAFLAGDPFSALADVTLTDPENVPLIGPLGDGYQRLQLLQHIARGRGLTDGEALELAELLLGVTGL